MNEIKEKKMRIVATILSLGVIAFCFFTMLYSDNVINSGIGYNLVKSIHGGSFDYFLSTFDWAYGVSIYIFYSIWSIPVLFISEIFKVENIMENVFVLLWYKTLLVLFAIWSIYLVGKISSEIKAEVKIVQINYISSVFFIFPVIAIAQCDIISICFVLLGVYAYIKEQNIRFIAYFAIAMTMKYFALLVFIPLVLFRYRRIRKIVIVICAGIIFLFFTMFLTKSFGNKNIDIQNSNYYVNEHIMKFAQVVLDTNANGQIGLWGFFYFIICVISYRIPNNKCEDKKKYAIWLTLASYMCLFLFYPCNFYWYIMLAPFMMLMTFYNIENIRVNLLLEFFYGLSVMICSVYSQSWVLFGSNTFSYLCLKEQAIAMKSNAFQYFLERLVHIQLLDYIPLIKGISIASGLLFVFINFPGLKMETQQFDLPEEKKEIWSITWLRIMFLYLWLAIGVYCLCSSQNDYYFSNKAEIDFLSNDFDENSENEISEEKKNSILATQCEYEGKVKFIDGDAWMRGEFTTILHLKEKISKDIKYSIYGYTVSGNTPISVYVNDRLVGTLQKEDENQNLTNRFIVIPQEYFAETKELKITISAKPELTVEDNIPISITLNKIEVSLVN